MCCWGHLLDIANACGSSGIALPPGLACLTSHVESLAETRIGALVSESAHQATTLDYTVSRIGPACLVIGWLREGGEESKKALPWKEGLISHVWNSQTLAVGQYGWQSYIESYCTISCDMDFNRICLSLYNCLNIAKVHVGLKCSQLIPSKVFLFFLGKGIKRVLSRNPLHKDIQTLRLGQEIVKGKFALNFCGIKPPISIK